MSAVLASINSTESLQRRKAELQALAAKRAAEVVDLELRILGLTRLIRESQGTAVRTLDGILAGVCNG